MSFFEKLNPDFPVSPAAGWCKTPSEVTNLAKSVASTIIVGSITMESRAGNPGNTFNGTNLNALGLPNPGIKQVLSWAPDIIDLAHRANKPAIISIAGFTPSEYREIAAAVCRVGYDGAELNLGCPNLVDGGKRKSIASFDPKLVDEIVTRSCAATKTQKSDFFVSVKVSPMSNPADIVATAAVLALCSIDAVVTMNTFPNALLYNEDGSPQIQTPDQTGWAGLSGSGIKPMALGQVSQWRKALNDAGAKHTQVWGVGGVSSGCDVRDMQRAGAHHVQVGTAYFISGAKVFGGIAEEFFNL